MSFQTKQPLNERMKRTVLVLMYTARSSECSIDLTLFLLQQMSFPLRLNGNGLCSVHSKNERLGRYTAV